MNKQYREENKHWINQKRKEKYRKEHPKKEKKNLSPIERIKKLREEQWIICNL